jgi:hypothetical protein
MSRAFAGQENIANVTTTERRFATKFSRALSQFQSASTTVAGKNGRRHSQTSFVAE